MPMTLIRSTNNSDWLFDTILPIALCCHTHANSLPILLLSAASIRLSFTGLLTFPNAYIRMILVVSAWLL